MSDDRKVKKSIRVRSVTYTPNCVSVELDDHKRRKVLLESSRAQLLPCGENHEITIQYEPTGHENWAELKGCTDKLIHITGPGK